VRVFKLTRGFYAGFMVQESQFSFQFIFSFCSFY
jgi:hypothetical protein